jgi:hypothetical protein
MLNLLGIYTKQFQNQLFLFGMVPMFTIKSQPIIQFKSQLIQCIKVVSTNGCIPEAFGSYLADDKNKDDQITKHIAEDENKL